jgi:hypothetical protein
MRITAAVAIALCVGCSANGGGGGGSGGGAGAGGGDLSAGGGGGSDGGGGSGGWWKPTRNATFYWDLQNAPPAHDKNVGVYDIDGFNNDAAEVAALHALGLKVVCYMDAGTYEPNRPDSKQFPAALTGAAVAGWPGELWLDVRPSGPQYATLQSIMTKRFELCRDKGFDAVEPDNMDSYDNQPGFATSADDQLTYNRWIADTVHGLGMAVLQKNDLAQIAALQPSFDGILDEQCNEWNECDTLLPYVAAGKPAWDAEYVRQTAEFCAGDVAAGIIGARFAVELDGRLFEPCSNDIGKTQ